MSTSVVCAIVFGVLTASFVASQLAELLDPRSATDRVALLLELFGDRTTPQATQMDVLLWLWRAARFEIELAWSARWWVLLVLRIVELPGDLLVWAIGAAKRTVEDTWLALVVFRARRKGWRVNRPTWLGVRGELQWFADYRAAATSEVDRGTDLGVVLGALEDVKPLQFRPESLN